MARRNTTKLTPGQRAEVARKNGAKSHGPTTEEGKAKSSGNAVTHGLYTRHIVLSNEDPDIYARFRQSYLDDWQPVGPRERDLVIDIINARWRMRRVVLMETAAIDCAIERQRKAVDAEFEIVDDAIRVSLAYAGLHDDPSPSMTLLGRAETRLMRIIDRSTKMLLNLQAQRHAANAAANAAATPERTAGPDPQPKAPAGPHPVQPQHPPQNGPAPEPENSQNEPNVLEPAAAIRRTSPHHRNQHRHHHRVAVRNPRIPTIPRIARSRLLALAFSQKRTQRTVLEARTARYTRGTRP